MSVWLQLVVSNILVASLIALLAWQVGRSGRQATFAHVLWLAFFIKLITPPIVLMPIHVPADWFPATAAYTSTFPYLGSTSQPHSSASFLPATQHVSLTRAENTLVSQGSVLTQNFRLWTCLSCIWFCGFSIILIRGMIRFVRFHRLLVRAGKHDQEASCFVQQLLAANEVEDEVVLESFSFRRWAESLAVTDACFANAFRLWWPAGNRLPGPALAFPFRAGAARVSGTRNGTLLSPRPLGAVARVVCDRGLLVVSGRLYR